MNQDPKQLKSKARMVLEQYDDLLKYIIEKEIDKISKSPITASSEFDFIRQYFFNEGIKEGLRKISQELNKMASQ